MNDLVLTAMPIARRFEKEIGEHCTKKFKNGAMMCLLVSARILENVIISNFSRMHKVGSSEGLENIRKFYDGCQKDALDRWNNMDLNSKPNHLGVVK